MLKVAMSAYGARAAHAFSRLFLTFFLLQKLPHEEYAAFIVLGALEGWFLLFDFGLGWSLQNALASSRALGRGEESFLKTSALFSCLHLALGLLLLWFSTPFLAPFFLGKFLSSPSSFFFFGGSLLLVNSFSSLASKVLFARQAGSYAYLLQGGLSLLSLALLLLWKESLTLKSVFFLSYGLPGLVQAGLTVVFLFRCDWRAPLSLDLLKKGWRFFLFSLLASFVTLSDALLTPRILSEEDLIEYNLLCKMFGVVSFGMGVALQALSPVCSEALSLGFKGKVETLIRRFYVKSALWLLLFTFAILAISPLILHKTGISLSLSPLLFFSLYLVIRSFCDAYAMALQSMSHLSSFFYLVPLQACLSLMMQVWLGRHFGISGILIALSLSYLLTVFWVLPRKLHFHS